MFSTFWHKVRETLDEEVISLTLRGFNWEHSNSYIMRKLTNLFSLTMLFDKFKMLASFILDVLAIVERYTATSFSKGARS